MQEIGMKADLVFRSAVLCATIPVCTHGCSSEVASKPEKRLGISEAVDQAPASYTPDCNDPDDYGYGVPCVDLSPETQARLHASGYPYYLGHAEPSLLFFSDAPNSGSNMQWKVTLPTTDPNPTQNGSSVANFELFPAMWIGLALCDPNSKPYGPCTANSDTNKPATAGAAFLELQFYPPGAPSNINGTSCPSGKWCANLHINTAQDNSTFVSTQCSEPTTQQYLTTSGVPTTMGGSVLAMSTGDVLVVTVHDTANGLQTDLKDVTSGASGTMTARGSNGFVHNTTQINSGQCSVTTSTTCTKNSDCPASEFCACQTEQFDFHAMYNTAKPGQVVPWATLGPNVAFDAEIGHFELCGDSACATLPDNGDDGLCSTTFKICKVNGDCPAGETCSPQTVKQCRTSRGIGGCGSVDLDQDGVCFQPDWADGTAAHPGSVIIGSPNDTGVGPLSASGPSATSYIQGYGTITFQTTPPSPASATFYPFYSQAGTGASCVFDLGNDIPGVTTNNFGRIAQYGTSITNPCFPGPVARCKDVTVDADSSCQGTASGSDVNDGSSDPDGDTLSYTLSPPGPYGRGPNTVTLTATDPGGAKSTCVATVTVVDSTPPTFDAGNPTSLSIVSCQPGVVPETLTAPTATDICGCLSYAGVVTAVDGVATSIPLTQTGLTTFQALLPVGELTVQWTATNCDGVASAPFTQTVTVMAAPALYARQRLGIGVKASVLTPTSAPAPIDNNGTEVRGVTSLGVGASAGAVLSVPDVKLVHATVDSVISGGEVVNLGGTVRTGVVQEFTAPTLPPFPTVGVTTYPANHNEVVVPPGQTLDLAPGSYDDVAVKPGGVLALRAGTYLINELTVAPAATLEIDNTGGTVNVDVQTHIVSLGVVESNGQPNQFVLGYSGVLPVQLLTSFSGVVVAPTAALHLGEPISGTYSGAFYAQDISVAPGVTVIESPFGCQ
jgi:hypothetical protein